MNIYLESVNLDEIRTATGSGVADGIVFSHVALSADAPDADANGRLEEIARAFALPVCVAVSSVTSADIYREGRELAKLSDHIIVEVPLMEDALEPIRRLNAEGVTVCATFVFNGAQAVLAAKAGASMVRVTLEDLDANGQSGTAAVADIKSILEAGSEECDVLVGSPSTASQFSEAVLSGADIICLKPAVLRSLITHPLSDRGVDRFLSDLSRRPRGRTQS
jgi:transaldolase